MQIEEGLGRTRTTQNNNLELSWLVVRGILGSCLPIFVYPSAESQSQRSHRVGPAAKASTSDWETCSYRPQKPFVASFPVLDNIIMEV